VNEFTTAQGSEMRELSGEKKERERKIIFL
jgi:hypothetical protein